MSHSVLEQAILLVFGYEGKGVCFTQVHSLTVLLFSLDSSHAESQK